MSTIIQRALISVYDKTGLVKFGQFCPKGPKCKFIHTTLKNDEGLKDHMRQKHKIYQSGPF